MSSPIVKRLFTEDCTNRSDSDSPLRSGPTNWRGSVALSTTSIGDLQVGWMRIKKIDYLPR